MGNLKAITKGQKYLVQAPSQKKIHSFMAGGRKRVLFDPVRESSMGWSGKIGFIYVNAEIRLADGTEAYGLVCLDETSSGEHYDTLIMCPSGVMVYVDAPEDLRAELDRPGLKIFPFTYKPTGLVKCEDHHLGEDGWSLPRLCDRGGLCVRDTGDTSTPK